MLEVPRPKFRYRREIHPVHFPVEAEVPETKLHLDLRTGLYHLLRLELAGRACVGSDQFVYWNARDPRRCLSPDAFLKHGVPDEQFPVWKVWERGAPEVAVEIVSPSDDRTWDWKLESYHELGVRELVRFDPEAPEGARLEVWDLIEGDLAPRSVEGECAESWQLVGLYWVVRPLDGALGLRLARGGPEGPLLPTPSERESRRADEEARRADEETRRADAAERRLAELEAELAKRK